MLERSLLYCLQWTVLCLQGVGMNSGGQDYPSDSIRRRMGHRMKAFGVGMMLAPPTNRTMRGGAGLMTRKTLSLFLSIFVTAMFIDSLPI